MSCRGIVKSYNAMKGFGFIVPENGDQDVFVLRTDVMGGSLVTGDNVSFDQGVNDRTGKAKAVNVHGGSGPPETGKGGMPGMGGKGGGKGGMPCMGGKGGGFGGGGMPGFGGGFPGPGGPMGGGGFGGGAGQVGMVKFFNDEKGFGFITPGDGGGDVFVHSNDIQGNLLREGDQVQYDAIINDRTGKPKATNVRGGTGGDMMLGGGKAGGKRSGGKGGGKMDLGGPPLGGMPGGMPGGFKGSGPGGPGGGGMPGDMQGMPNMPFQSSGIGGGVGGPPMFGYGSQLQGPGGFLGGGPGQPPMGMGGFGGPPGPDFGGFPQSQGPGGPGNFPPQQY